jgi:hypothetical protein
LFTFFRAGWKNFMPGQGCQMICFQTKYPNLGKFLRAIEWICWYMLCSSGIFYGHLVYFVDIWKCCGNVVYFPSIWYIGSRKIWQPCTREQNPRKTGPGQIFRAWRGKNFLLCNVLNRTDTFPFLWKKNWMKEEVFRPERLDLSDSHLLFFAPEL